MHHPVPDYTMIFTICCRKRATGIGCDTGAGPAGGGGRVVNPPPATRVRLLQTGAPDISTPHESPRTRRR